MDVYSREKRSKVMASVPSTNTKLEILVRKYLFSQGFRFRINVKNLPGKPDIVLKRYKTVIFVNGCFWHGHNDCKRSQLPKSNVEYWKSKIEKNKNRDKVNIEKLLSAKWKVIVIWECQIRNTVSEESKFWDSLCMQIKNNFD